MYLTNLMDFSGELQNPLGGRGLAGIDVSEDAYISVVGQVSHVNSLKVWILGGWVMAAFMPITAKDRSRICRTAEKQEASIILAALNSSL